MDNKNNFDKNWHHIDLTTNLFLRSSLFGLSQKGVRKEYKNYRIFCNTGLEVEYRGLRLSQYDRDISIALKKIAIEKGQGAEVWFDERDIFKKLRYKNYGANDKDFLYESLKGMFTSVYCFSDKHSSFEGMNAKSFKWDSKKNLFKLVINNKWIDYFTDNPETSLYNLKQRLSLPRGFPRWLHGYWSSYVSIPPTDVHELRKLCGSSEKLIGNFKKKVIYAMDNLEKIGFIKPDWIVNLHGYITAEKL